MPKQIQGKLFIRINEIVKQSIDHIQKQQYKQACNLLSEVLRHEPDHANSLYLMSICLKHQNYADKSKQMQEIANNLNEHYYKNNCQELSIFLEKINRTYRENSHLLRKVHNLSHEQWLQIIQPFLDAGDYNSCELILKYFQILINKQEQYNDQTISHFGIKYYEIGKYEKSIQKYEQAILLSPKDPMYYHNVALLNYALGNYVKSEQYIIKSLQIDPNRPKSFYLQSFLYSKTGRIEQALQKIKNSLSQTGQQILYKIKMITTLLLYFPDKIKEAKKHIKEGLNLLQKNANTGVYFKGRQAFPAILKFMNEEMQKKIRNKNWKQYLGLVDDYLIKGLSDKAKIKYRMKQLCALMIEQIKTEQRGNNQINCEDTKLNKIN